MHSSKDGGSAINLLNSVEPGRNSVLFYDNDNTLEKFLFNYVKTGLEKGEHVFYWAGIRNTSEAERRMSQFGIDCDHYKRNGLLSLASYDDMLLADGRIDPIHCLRKLHNLITHHDGGTYRLATESNWYLLSDVFEKAIDMEATHDLAPHNISIICSYNIRDLMKYANIYHMAKLIELHDDTIVTSKGAVMRSLDFYSYLGKCIINVLEDSFEYLTIVRKKHSRFISEILSELEMRIGSDMIELERKVEEKIMRILKLNVRT